MYDKDVAIITLVQESSTVQIIDGSCYFSGWVASLQILFFSVKSFNAGQKNSLVFGVGHSTR